MKHSTLLIGSCVLGTVLAAGIAAWSRPVAVDAAVPAGESSSRTSLHRDARFEMIRLPSADQGPILLSLDKQTGKTTRMVKPAQKAWTDSRWLEIPRNKHKNDKAGPAGQGNYQITYAGSVTGIGGGTAVYLMNVDTGATWYLEPHAKQASRFRWRAIAQN